MGNLVQSFINYFGLIIKFGEETHPLAKLLKTIFDHGFIAQKGRSTSKLRLEGLFIHIENKPHSDIGVQRTWTAHIRPCTIKKLSRRMLRGPICLLCPVACTPFLYLDSYYLINFHDTNQNNM